MAKKTNLHTSYSLEDSASEMIFSGTPEQIRGKSILLLEISQLVSFFARRK
jgi:hypothetical protein